MKNNPKVSVIIACYNTVDYIDECLASLKNQIFKDFEAIIVDDGSTDGSSEIIDRYVAEDSRFKLFRVNHIGFPLAKNIGLENATGDYIIFLDSDDCVYPYWLFLLYKISQETKADITTCLYDKFKTPKKATEPPFERVLSTLNIAEFDYLKMIFLYATDCLSYMWNKLIKKELYADIRFVDQLALSDVSVMYKIFHKANKIIQVKTPLIHYRQHDKSMCVTTRRDKVNYKVFRLGIYKPVFRFIFDNYPQARYITQIMLHREIDDAKRALKQDFDTLIDLSDVQYILDAKTIRFLL